MGVLVLIYPQATKNQAKSNYVIPTSSLRAGMKLIK